MSLFSLFSNCGMCCNERDDKRNPQSNLSNSQASNPDRTRQLILESQKQNNLTGSGNFGGNYNSGQNAVDPVDGFIEITPIFHGPKSGSGSGSGSDGVEEDYCEIIDVELSQRQFSSSSNRSQKETQQVYQEFVSLPIKNAKRRSDYLHGASGGGQGNNDPSYKQSMRSRNSSSHSSQDGGSQTRLEKQGKRSTKAWTEEEDRLLRFYYSKHNGKWPAIANEMADRNASQCSQRWRRIKPSKIRRPWTPEEDTMVLALIKQHGKNWGLISSQMDNRSGKQVRERYINKLDPELNNNQFNEEEDRIIIDKYYKIGPKWSEIAKYLTGRSENMVKNRFYSYIKKTYAINSIQGGTGRSDTGSWYETNSSPRVNNDNDKASSYASSLYNDLDPSINSGNLESEETSSEGEQYNQFSLGPNPGQALGLVDEKKGFTSGNINGNFNYNMNNNNNTNNNNYNNTINNSINNNNNNRQQDDFFKQQDPMYLQQQQNNQFYQNMPIQQQQQQQYAQQQNVNNNAYFQNTQQFNQQQNQQQLFMMNQENQQNQNKLGFQQNFGNNQKANQYKKIENEKAEEMFHTPRLALANNSSFFPTDIFIQQQRMQQDEVMNSSGQQSLGNNFFNASPSPLILLSPAQMKTEQFSFTSNTPGRRFMVSNSNTPYTNNPNNNLSSQTSNVHFNFNNIATTPNYKVQNSAQQTPYQNSHQQQVQQHYSQNYIQQQSQQQQQFSASSNQMVDSSGFNQSIFNFSAGNQFNTPSQQPMQNIKINVEDTNDSFNLNSQGSASNPQQNLHGTYFLPPISPGQNINEYGFTNDQQGSLSLSHNNSNRNQYPREELRLDVSCNKGDEQQQQQFNNNSNNNQFPLATPKIDRKQLKNMIVDLESQLQLLKVQQQNMNDQDSDC